MITKSVLVTMKRMIAVVLLGALVTISTVLIPAEPAHASIVSDVANAVIGPVKNAITAIKNTIVGAVNAAKNAILGAVNAAKNAILGAVNAAKNAILGAVNVAKGAILAAVDVVLDVVKEIHGALSDFITLIIGLNPNNLHSFVVANLNEDACLKLPGIVNNVGGLGNALPAFPKLPFISDLVSFADLQLNLPDIVGIDPASADSDDLFLFKTRTDLPIATLAGMAEFPYTIPSGVAVAFSSFCVEATERHLAVKEDVDKFRNQLHHDLALGGRPHATNALNQLPAAQGGLLEDVRFVVSETINLFVEAGEEPGEKTLRELAKGDAAFTEGSFREAYNHYQAAYSALTDLDDDRDDNDDD